MAEHMKKIGRVAVNLTADTKQVEAALDRVKKKLEAVTRAAIDAAAAVSKISGAQ